MNDIAQFTWIDWTIVALYVAVAITVGLIARGRVNTISDFLVAGRQVRYHLGIATLVATELGLITMMYFSEQGFKFGFSAFIIGIIWTAAYYLVGKTGFVIDRIRTMEILTITEYFERRYSKGVRVLGAALLTVAGVLSLGVFLKLGAVFIVHFMNLPETSLHLTMSASVVIVVAYTILGGMLSVALTDFVQFVVLSVSMVVTTVLVVTQHGGFDFFAKVATLYGEKGLDPLIQPEYGLSFIAYWSIFAVSGCILWQPVVQRVFAVHSPELNRSIFKTTSIMFLGRAFFPIIWGIGAALYYGVSVEATAGMPMFLAEILPVGILGLLAAGMFAAMMSTDSGYILAWSSIIVQDLISPFRKVPFSNSERLLWSRGTILVIGGLMLVFGIWYEVKETAFRYLLDVTTVYYAGGFAVLVSGLYWKRATTAGAYGAFALGSLLPLVFVVEDMILQSRGVSSQGYVAQMLPPNVRGMLSFILGFVGMGLGSFISPGIQRQSSEKDTK
ncbi:MAG: sodium:solute symporter family protein [Ignavibacteriales bacterium]|nr:sodium:solute symporter family protein [Ignavibacteriales bacterium]